MRAGFDRREHDLGAVVAHGDAAFDVVGEKPTFVEFQNALDGGAAAVAHEAQSPHATRVRIFVPARVPRAPLRVRRRVGDEGPECLWSCAGSGFGGNAQLLHVDLLGGTFSVYVPCGTVVGAWWNRKRGNDFWTRQCKHTLDAGIADLSLRELAEAIGTSHRMLIYHFGTRGRTARCGRTSGGGDATRDRVRIRRAPALPEDARAFWKRISNPKLWPQERLFFELYVHALLGRPGTEGFLDDVVESWIAPIADAAVAAGGDKRTARADARLAVAVVRGLILDLLATGDRKGVTDAFDRYLGRVGLPGG